ESSRTSCARGSTCNRSPRRQPAVHFRRRASLAPSASSCITPTRIPMSTTDNLIPLLKKLRLSGVLQSLDLRTRQAVDDDLSHGEFLLRLLSDEVERRDSKQLDMRLRRASFEGPRSIEDFD